MEILRINKHPENIISEYIREKLNDKDSTSAFLNKCIYIEQMEIDHREADHFSVEGFSVEDMNEEYERIEDDLKDISSKEEMIRTCRSRSYSEPRSISFNIRMRDESKKLEDIRSEYILEHTVDSDITSDNESFEKVCDLVTIEEQVLGNVNIGYHKNLYETDIQVGDYIEIKNELKDVENVDYFGESINNVKSDFITDQVDRMNSIGADELKIIDALIDIENYVLDDTETTKYDVPSEFPRNHRFGCHVKFLEFAVRTGIDDALKVDDSYKEALSVLSGQDDVKSDFIAKKIVQRGTEDRVSKALSELDDVIHDDDIDFDSIDECHPAFEIIREDQSRVYFPALYHVASDKSEEYEILRRYMNEVSERVPTGRQREGIDRDNMQPNKKLQYPPKRLESMYDILKL